MRTHRKAARTVRITKRCLDLLRLLRSARWLTTTQIQRRFFAGATMDAVRKRLRKLVQAEYLVRAQPNRTHVAFFTLGRRGKYMLEAA